MNTTFSKDVEMRLTLSSVVCSNAPADFICSVSLAYIILIYIVKYQPLGIYVRYPILSHKTQKAKVKRWYLGITDTLAFKKEWKGNPFQLEPVGLYFGIFLLVPSPFPIYGILLVISEMPNPYCITLCVSLDMRYLHPKTPWKLLSRRVEKIYDIMLIL